MSAARGNGQAFVSFSAPSSNGGSPVTGYIANCNGIDYGGSSPITVGGLTNGVTCERGWTLLCAIVGSAFTVRCRAVVLLFPRQLLCEGIQCGRLQLQLGNQRRHALYVVVSSV